MCQRTNGAAILNTGLFLDDLPQGRVDQAAHDFAPSDAFDSGDAARRGCHSIDLRDGKNRNFCAISQLWEWVFEGRFLVNWFMKASALMKTTKYCGNKSPSILLKATRPLWITTCLFRFSRRSRAGTVEFLFPDFIRTVVGDYLSQKYPIQ